MERKCTQCPVVFMAPDRGRPKLTCSAECARLQRNQSRRQKYKTGDIRLPCCITLGPGRKCPQHQTLTKVKNSARAATRIDPDPEIDSELKTVVIDMLQSKSGTVVTRPARFRQTVTGPDEGYSTWFYAEIYGYNEKWVSTKINAENDNWWSTINLKELGKTAELPDGRWYKTQAAIPDVIRGFELCCSYPFSSLMPAQEPTMELSDRKCHKLESMLSSF